jgi:hypothetical protein
MLNMLGSLLLSLLILPYALLIETVNQKLNFINHRIMPNTQKFISNWKFKRRKRPWIKLQMQLEVLERHNWRTQSTHNTTPLAPPPRSWRP